MTDKKKAPGRDYGMWYEPPRGFRVTGPGVAVWLGYLCFLFLLAGEAFSPDPYAVAWVVSLYLLMTAFEVFFGWKYDGLTLARRLLATHAPRRALIAAPSRGMESREIGQLLPQSARALPDDMRRSQDGTTEGDRRG